MERPFPDNAANWADRWVVALALLGAALRLVRWAQGWPLWGDESMLAVHFLERSFAQLFAPLDYHQVAPFGFLAAESWAVGAFGFSERSLRLVPLACALASVPLFVRLAGRVLTPSGRVVAVATFAVAHPLIRYAGEAKPYAGDLLASLALVLVAVEWRRARAGSRWPWALAALLPLALAFSLPALFVVGAVGLALAPYVIGRWRSEWPGALAASASLAASLLALGALGQYRTDSDDRAYFLKYWASSFPPLDGPAELGAWLAKVHLGPLFAYPQGGGGPLAALALLGFVAGALLLGRRERWLGALLVLPFLLNLTAAALRRYPYGEAARVAQFLAPMVVVGAARGWSWAFRERARWAGALALGMVAFGLAQLGRDLGSPYRAPQDHVAREAARRFWSEADKDAVTLCARADLGLGPGSWRYDATDIYLCYQAIYSPRRRDAAPPDWDAVDAGRPLRCVLWNLRPGEFPEFRAWLRSGPWRAAKVRVEPVVSGGPDEPAQAFVVCDLVRRG